MILIHLSQYAIFGTIFIALWLRKLHAPKTMTGLLVTMLCASAALFYQIPATAFGVLWIWASGLAVIAYLLSRMFKNFCAMAMEEAMLRSYEGRSRKPR